MRKTLVRRSALTTALAVLTLVPAASAKGPGAFLSPTPAGVEPGRAWVTTVTLYEHRRPGISKARPTVIVRDGASRFSLRPKRLAVHIPRFKYALVRTRYRFRMAVPRAGRWSVTVLDGVPGGLRFRFPSFEVGGQSVRTSKADVVFAEGSRPVPKRATRGSAAVSRGGDGALSIVPAGLALALGGAGLTLLRRRRTP